MLQDNQGAWFFLMHCVSARANCVVVRQARSSGAVCSSARLSRILQFESSTIGEDTRDVTTLPLVLGSLGFAVPSAPELPHIGRVGQIACP